MAVPVYIPTNNAQGFPFLYILTCNFYLFDNSHFNMYEVSFGILSISFSPKSGQVPGHWSIILELVKNVKFDVYILGYSFFGSLYPMPIQEFPIPRY